MVTPLFDAQIALDQNFSFFESMPTFFLFYIISNHFIPWVLSFDGQKSIFSSNYPEFYNWIFRYLYKAANTNLFEWYQLQRILFRLVTSRDNLNWYQLVLIV